MQLSTSWAFTKARVPTEILNGYPGRLKFPLHIKPYLGQTKVVCVYQIFLLLQHQKILVTALKNATCLIPLSRVDLRAIIQVPGLKGDDTLQKSMDSFLSAFPCHPFGSD